MEKVCTEFAEAAIGQRFGKIFVLSRQLLAIDFRLQESKYLFISVEPNLQRIYLIRRRLKDLENASGNPSSFIVNLRKRLSGAELISVEKISDERVVRFYFKSEGDLGAIETLGMIIQLTGRSANLFLVNQDGLILDRLRETKGEGQEIGTIYSPPSREGKKAANEEEPEISDKCDVSEELDRFYLEKEAEERFRSRADAALKKISKEIAKHERLRDKLYTDLENHGEPERWKRFGDLILANLATAKRNGNQISLIDFFAEPPSEIEIDADENDSLTEAAEKYFKRYAKSRNARAEIAKRMQTIGSELVKLNNKKKELEASIAAGDDSLFRDEDKQDKPEKIKKGNRKPEEYNAARRFVSSDGFEILVGKKAKDNEYLTFRIAKSLDTWLHAADYPGSHVVIRNPNRKEIPQRTLLEAAQLAAFYSSGKSQPKAAVHYTKKKFVNKPRRAAPGLVSLASFKTILVEPIIEAQRAESNSNRK